MARRTLDLADDTDLTADVLKSAYNKKAKTTHPDAAGGSQEAFLKVQQAHVYLNQLLQKPAAAAAATASQSSAWSSTRTVRPDR